MPSDSTVYFLKNGRETARVIQKFSVFTECLIPQVVGAIDGTNVEIICPESENKVDYYSRKKKDTVNIQAVVGADLVFLDIATRFSGSIHDARVLRSTSLFAQSERRDILDSPQELISGLLVRSLILGHSANPSTTWQVKPYSFNLNLPNTEKSFNKHLSSAKVTVDRAFWVLKGRWRCLLKRLDNDLESASSIIITCCVLHNICQQNHNNYIDDDDVLENVLEQERRERPNRISNYNFCYNAEALREILTQHFKDNT